MSDENEKPAIRPFKSANKALVIILLCILAIGLFNMVTNKKIPMEPVALPLQNENEYVQIPPSVDVVIAPSPPTAELVATPPEQAPTSPPPAPPVPPAPVKHEESEKIRELEERISSLEQQIKEQSEITSEENSKATSAWKVVLYWQAYDELKTRMESGLEYSDALERSKLLARGNDRVSSALAKLEPYKEGGVMTKTQLSELFRQSLKTAIKNPSAEEAGEDFQSIRKNLRGLVTIRKINQKEGNSFDAIVARAEQSLNAGLLYEAAVETEKLPVEDKSFFEQFIQMTKQHENAFKALAEIRLLISTSAATVREN